MLLISRKADGFGVPNFPEGKNMDEIATATNPPQLTTVNATRRSKRGGRWFQADLCLVDVQRQGQDTSSASHAPAQFRMEFGANRSDDVCSIILGEAADEKHLISQRQACCDVLWKHRVGSRPRKR